MQISALEISGLRNIEYCLVRPGSSGNLIVGSNGAGKTSFLEAIYMLGNARTFRGGYSQSLVNEGGNSLRVSARVVLPGGSVTELEVIKAGGSRKISVDRKLIPNRSTLVRQFPVMFFGHESIAAQITSSEARRGFLDWLLFHVEPGFHSVFSGYQGVFNQYRASLRARRGGGEVWVSSLAELGEQINSLRQTCYQELRDLFLSELTKFPELPQVELVYRCGWGADNSLEDWLSSKQSDHERLGYCTVGPQRADLQLRNNRGEVRSWASRGQLKVYYGLLFLTFLRYLLKTSDARPLLLIDDLWAEVDQAVADRVLSELMGGGLQVFISSLESRDEIFKGYDMKLFHVERGLVT